MLCGIVAVHYQKPFEPMTLMVLLGIALYLPYIAVHTTILERLIAVTQVRGNLGYLMSMVDAIGYLGYVFVLIARKTVVIEGNLLSFFLQAAWIAGLLSCGAVLVSVWYLCIRRAVRPVRPIAPSSLK